MSILIFFKTLPKLILRNFCRLFIQINDFSQNSFFLALLWNYSNKLQNTTWLEFAMLLQHFNDVHLSECNLDSIKGFDYLESMRDEIQLEFCEGPFTHMMNVSRWTALQKNNFRAFKNYELTIFVTLWITSS